MGIQYKNTENSIKRKNYPKSKTLGMLNKPDIDRSLVAFYKAKCSGRMNTSEKMYVDSIQSPTSTASTQIESS